MYYLSVGEIQLVAFGIFRVVVPSDIVFIILCPVCYVKIAERLQPCLLSGEHPHIAFQLMHALDVLACIHPWVVRTCLPTPTGILQGSGRLAAEPCIGARIHIAHIVGEACNFVVVYISGCPVHYLRIRPYRMRIYSERLVPCGGF